MAGLCLLALGSACSAGDCPPSPEQVLRAVNLVRESAQHCGPVSFSAAPALTWHPALAASAQRFAEELARRDTLSHEGEISRTLRERLRVAGYPFRSAGENLAAGPETIDDALAQWLSSPEHCENLMQPNFRDIGLACVPGSGRYARFWVMHLGRSP